MKTNEPMTWNEFEKEVEVVRECGSKIANREVNFVEGMNLRNRVAQAYNKCYSEFELDTLYENFIELGKEVFA